MLVICSMEAWAERLGPACRGDDVGGLTEEAGVGIGAEQLGPELPGHRHAA